MTLAIRRITTDWGALCRAEVEGREAPGTVGRLLAEATGHTPAAENDVGVTVNALLRLAESLRVPNDVKRQITELNSAAQASKAAAQAVKDEQNKLAKAQNDLAAERAKHEAAIARELKDHQSALAAGHAELASVKEQASDIKAKAEFALATATALK
jgi:hypothetical protein